MGVGRARILSNLKMQLLLQSNVCEVCICAQNPQNQLSQSGFDAVPTSYIWWGKRSPLQGTRCVVYFAPSYSTRARAGLLHIDHELPLGNLAWSTFHLRMN